MFWGGHLNSTIYSRKWGREKGKVGGNANGHGETLKIGKGKKKGKRKGNRSWGRRRPFPSFPAHQGEKGRGRKKRRGKTPGHAGLYGGRKKREEKKGGGRAADQLEAYSVSFIPCYEAIKEEKRKGKRGGGGGCGPSSRANHSRDPTEGKWGGKRKGKGKRREKVICGPGRGTYTSGQGGGEEEEATSPHIFFCFFPWGKKGERRGVEEGEKKRTTENTGGP